MNIEHVKQKALAYLLQHGSHPSAVHVFGTKGSAITLLENVPEQEQSKRKALFLLGRKTAQTVKIGPLQQMFLVSEAWVSLKQSMNRLSTPPATDPERKEALVVYGIDLLTKEQRMFVFEMVRDREGIVRTIQSLMENEEVQAVSNPFLMTFLAGYASETLGKRNP